MTLLLPTKRWATAKALLDVGEDVDYTNKTILFYFTRLSSNVSEKLEFENI